MTACPVARCPRPAHPGWTICDADAADLERTLAELPALADQLRITLTRQTGRSHGPAGGTFAAPLPFDWRASEATWVLRSTLLGWIRELEPEPTRHPADLLDVMGAWLLGRHGQLLVHPDAAEAVDELSTATGNAWRTIDTPPDRVFLGACPQCGAADVHAPATAINTTCPACRTTLDVDGLRSALTARLGAMLVTGPEFAGIAVTHLGIAATRDRIEARIHTWHTRGKITPSGHVQRAGSPMPTYRFAELAARIEETR